MDRWHIVLIMIICFIGVSFVISAGGLNGGAGGVKDLNVSTKDVELVYEAIKSAGGFSLDEMKDFNQIKYEVVGNKIILNKKGVFYNREVLLEEKQTCLDYNEPSCIKWGEEVKPECLRPEVRPEVVCLKRERLEEPVKIIYDEMPKDNPCIEWEMPKDCVDWDAKLGLCYKYEKELQCFQWTETPCLEMSERKCVSETKFSRDDFIQMAIKKEIESVKGIIIERGNRTMTQVDTNGRLIIK